MKKNYFLMMLLISAIAVNLNAQFVELDGKEPVIQLKFEDVDAAGKLLAAGSEAFGGFLAPDSSFVETDTVKGHAWGGGTFADFTYQEQIVNADAFDELLLPTMYWDSYLANPDRPQGVAFYSDGSGAYGGPRSTMGRTISLYWNPTDSLRFGNGAWNVPAFYVVGAQGDPGTSVGWRVDVDNKAFRIDWGGATDSTATNVFEANNEWIHLALTIPDGGARDGVKLYINGLEEELFWTDPDSEVTTINTKYSGTGWDGIFIQCMVNAWMADYRIYEEELTQTEIRKLLGLYPLSTQSIENKEMFNIYPVPNNGVFTVETAETGLNKVVIRNTLGQVVHNQIVDQKEMINVSSLPTGLYFVTVSDNQKNTQTRKFIIE